jgi:glutamate N-acetyltransferase/amino-acid N-acetyltransferase
LHSAFSIKNSVCAPQGFFADGISAGLKANGKKDVAFIYSDTPCDISYVLTTNTMQAAPLKHLKQQNELKTNFVLINAKNANAMTGQAGIDDINEILQSSDHPLTNPVMSSTGVIGVRLPKEKIINALQNFDLSVQNGNSAAEAIMTTDSFSKSIAFDVVLDDGSSFKIGAIAKGAGMINPAMATMLCFITTDAAIPKADMDELLQSTTVTTFNAISVDGDTSTNDTVMLLANGKSGAYDKQAFKQTLHNVMQHLALQMVKDGEGAKKMVAFNVTGAKNDEEAQIAAKALSNSLLVKTALFGEDPNWGRIAATVGASGVTAFEDKLNIAYNDVKVYDQGENLFSPEIEEKAGKILQQDQFTIHCDLGVADGKFRAYGCDLGYEYVKINADYRT